MGEVLRHQAWLNSAFCLVGPFRYGPSIQQAPISADHLEGKVSDAEVIHADQWIHLAAAAAGDGGGYLFGGAGIGQGGVVGRRDNDTAQ
jgi:hypothetical protein